MTPKRLITAALLVFVVGSVAYTILGDPQSGGRDPLSPARATVAAENTDAKVVVYFFYNDIRCSTCLKLEEYARETLDVHFADELASGEIAWRALSLDSAENEHYAIEFELYSKSLVLVEMENGEQVRWKNLEEIWELVYDKPAYSEYMRANLLEFLGESP